MKSSPVAGRWRGRLNTTFASLLVGQVSAQVFSLLGILLIPHFYSAADFGVFSLLMAANFIVQPLITFRLETAMLDVTAGNTAALFRLGVERALRNWLILIPLTALAGWGITRAFEVPWTAPMWFTVIAASYVTYTLTYSLLLAEHASRQVALTRVSQAVAFFGLMVGFSFTGWGFHALALAYTLSFLVPTTLFLGRSLQTWRASVPLMAAERAAVLKKYALSATPQSVLNTFSQYLLNFVISRFGMVTVGQFAYAQRLGATVQTSLGESFRQFAFIRYRQRLLEGEATLHSEVVRDTLLLGLVSVFTLVAFNFVKDISLFNKFFGSNMNILFAVLLWYCAALTNIPSNVAANTLGMQRQLLIFELITMLVRGSVAIVGLTMSNSETLIKLFCYTSVITNLALILYITQILKYTSSKAYKNDLSAKISQYREP